MAKGSIVTTGVVPPPSAGGAAPASAPQPPEHANTRVAAVAGVAAIGGFLFGFDTSVINGAVKAIRETFDTSAWVSGLTVSSALLGSALGAWVAGRIADRFGRVRTMQVAAVLFFVSAVGSFMSLSTYDLMGWRVLGGFAVGVASVICPTYIAETAPASKRGRLGSFQQLAIVLGIFVALLSDYVLATAAGGANEDLWLGIAAWRWMFLTGILPALLYLLGLVFIPQSPRYLVAIGRERAAASVLLDLGETKPTEKIASIKETLRGEFHPRLRDLRGPLLGLLPIVWSGILLSAFQQLVGINVIFYYSSSLWSAVGFSDSNSLLITVITSVTNIATTFIALALVDKFGRRPLLLVGSAGMFVSLGVLAAMFATADRSGGGDPHLGPVAGPVALVAANLFVVFFGASWGPVVWVLLGEMFPNKIRAIALSVAAAVQWITNFAVSTTFPVLQDTSLVLAYGIYTTAAAVSFVFVFKAIKETKGRELESM